MEPTGDKSQHVHCRLHLPQAQTGVSFGRNPRRAADYAVEFGHRGLLLEGHQSGAGRIVAHDAVYSKDATGPDELLPMIVFW